jgi:methyltransferase
MVISRRAYFGLLGLLILERGCELWLSRRNARRAYARGGVEVGRRQYPVMVGFHVLFIMACATEAKFRNPRLSPLVSWVALIGEAGAQALRYWAVATLSDRWNTRVIIAPDEPPITTGPYGYVRHPNYAAVVLEIACVPLIRGLWITATVFSAANALLLASRIRLEENALGDYYTAIFARRPRFIPDLLGGFRRQQFSPRQERDLRRRVGDVIQRLELLNPEDEQGPN